jgi:hypothetical protein
MTNRVAIILDENGEFSGVVADSEIEFFVVQPSCDRDRVYRYSSGQFGPQYVQAAFDERPVGHIDDDMLEGGAGYGKEPPSKPKLTLV